MSSIAVKPKKRGRPATGKDPLVGVRFPADLLAEIDTLAAERGMSRSDLIRVLTRNGLTAFRLTSTRDAS